MASADLHIRQAHAVSLLAYMLYRPVSKPVLRTSPKPAAQNRIDQVRLETLLHAWRRVHNRAWHAAYMDQTCL